MARYTISDDVQDPAPKAAAPKARYTISEDDTPPQERKNNPVGFTLNSINKGLAGIADTVINAPRNLNNLGRAGVGYALGEMGFDYKPDVTVPNNTVHNMMKDWRQIREEYDPTSPGGRVADYAIQSVTGAVVSPGSLVKNVVTGAIGGTAGGVTQEATDSPLAGIFASVAAPGTGSLATAGKRRIGRNKLTESGVNNMAGDRFLEASGMDKQTLLSQLDQHQDIIPGSEQTSAQALKNGGLAGMQRTYETMPGRLDDSISIPDAFALRYAQQREAQAGHLNEAIPAQNGASAFQHGIANDVNAAVANVGNKSNTATGNIAQNMTPEYAGGVAKQVIDERYRQAKLDTKAAYEAIDPHNESRVSMPLSEMQAVVDKYYPLAPNDIPPQLQNLIKVASEQGDTVPLSTVSALRSMAGRYANDAPLENRTLAAAAGQMKRILSDVPELAADAGVIPGEMADRVRKAVALRRTQGEAFETGATNNLNRRDSNNAAKLEDAKIMRNFLNGSPDDAKRYMAAIGDDKAAKAAAESHIKSQFESAVFKPDGQIKKNFTDDYAKFTKQYRPVLNHFPELKARIVEAMKLQASAAKTGETLKGGGLRHFLDNRDPDKAVNSLLGSATKELDISDIEKAIRNNPTAKGNLAGGVKDGILNKQMQMGAADILDNPVWNQGQALKTLKDPKNMRLLNMLLDDGQKAKLGAFKADLESTQFTKNANRASGSNTQQNLQNNALVSLASKKPGVGLAKTIWQAAESIGDERLKANFTKMLLEPKHAAKIIREMKPTARSQLAEAFIKNLGIYGQVMPHVSDEE